jgi:hypothetical protein
MPLFRRKKKDDLKLEVTSTITAPAEADAIVLDQLRDLGSDLTQPRNARFYVYVPTLEAAHAASDETRAAGFVTMVDESAVPDSGNPWLVLASRDMVVDESTIADARRLFDGIAERYSGEYDGWDAAPD